MTGPDPESTTRAELESARQQVHVYKAITIATRDAHAVLDILLSANDHDAARLGLQERYDLTDVQARAVMEMQFRRLTYIDRREIERRHNELVDQIAAMEQAAEEA